MRVQSWSDRTSSLACMFIAAVLRAHLPAAPVPLLARPCERRHLNGDPQPSRLPVSLPGSPIQCGSRPGRGDNTCMLIGHSATYAIGRGWLDKSVNAGLAHQWSGHQPVTCCCPSGYSIRWHTALCIHPQIGHNPASMQMPIDVNMPSCRRPHAAPITSCRLPCVVSPPVRA